MTPLKLQQIAEWSGGILESGRADVTATRVSTDSRSVAAGDLFVALNGERFDGHEFVGAAVASGAVAVLVDHTAKLGELPESCGVIRVGSTLSGLQRLAAEYRRSLPVRVVGVTGSNGKTSTKEMIAAALGTRFRVHKTKGNLNNHIGVPLTLLEMDQETEWAVVEMGMNHPGEVRPLALMARPNISVITGIGWAHIEAFPNRQGIAKEKGEIIQVLASDGCAVLFGDDQMLKDAANWTKARVVTVGWSDHSDLRLANVTGDASGTQFTCSMRNGNEVQVRVPVFGRHMATNGGLALAVAHVAGLDLEVATPGLAKLNLPAGRLSIAPYESGWLIDDTYNASPDSVVAGISSLSLLESTGRRVVLLGCMAELGTHAAALHRWTGEQIAEHGVELLAVTGPFAGEVLAGAHEAGLPSAASVSVDSHEAMVEWYRERKNPGDVIFVKGSRSMKMERVVEMLKSGALC